MSSLEKKQKPEEDTSLVVLIQKSRILYLNDSIDKDSASKINKAILLLDEIENSPIKLFINSPGGEVSAGFFIFDCIRFVRSPVYIIGAGLVASAAALIYLSVDKKYRLSLPHARYMLHQPLSGMRGVVTDLEIHAREVSSLKSTINEIVAKGTDKKIKDIEKDTDRDFWLTAQEAKEYGLVHSIITKKEDYPTLFPKPEKQKDTEKEGNTTKKSTKKKASPTDAKNASTQSKPSKASPSKSSKKKK